MSNYNGFILTYQTIKANAIKYSFTNQQTVLISGITDVSLIDIWIQNPDILNYLLNRHLLNRMTLNKRGSGIQYYWYNWRNSSNPNPIVFDPISSTFKITFDEAVSGFIVYA